MAKKFPCTAETLEVTDENINTFAELMEHIMSDWGFGIGPERLVKEDGYYWINKTHITPTSLTYKTSMYIITNPLVYKKLEQFYKLLQESNTSKTLYK